jgi:hypothetical protein
LSDNNLSPAARFHALIATITVFVMFRVISFGLPALGVVGADYPVAGAASTLLGSVGVYRLLAAGLNWLLERQLWIKRLVFGPHFLHGTWVGYFFGHTGEKRYTVEHFDQNLDGLVISGRSYTSAQQEHGYWTTEATSIDARKGRLIYTYTFDVKTRSISLSGVSTFQFERSASHKAPEAISGFAHDLSDEHRIAVHEERISDGFVAWTPALKAAVDRFGGIRNANVPSG